MTNSPRLVVFFSFDATTGAPALDVTGQAFSHYKDDLGHDIAPPTILTLGGNAYGFLPVFADPARGISYNINANDPSTPGATLPLYVSGYLRPEDWAADGIETILGLCSQNINQDSFVWVAGKLTSCRLRSYDTADNALAGGDTGLLHSWDISAQYDIEGNCTGYQMTEP